MKQTSSRNKNYLGNKELALSLQPIAIKHFYLKVWPEAAIVELDNDSKNKLATMIDVGGADKMIKFKNGSLAFLAQRFRDWNHRNRNDFTIRTTELQKAIDALQSSGFIASFYAYGYSNINHTHFYKFRIFKYKEAIEYIVDNQLCKWWVPNKDGTRFYAIPFDKIPSNLFLLQDERDKQLGLWQE